MIADDSDKSHQTTTVVSQDIRHPRKDKVKKFLLKTSLDNRRLLFPSDSS